VRHESRQWIIELLIAANGEHLYPKQVFDAQAPPKNMNYPAIRKLMREMLRGGLRRDKDGYYLIKGNLTEKEIKTAHRKEFYEEAKLLIERHRRQRHTVASDFIWGLEELLKEERVIQIKRIKN
jgi:hypothetical protein